MEITKAVVINDLYELDAHYYEIRRELEGKGLDVLHYNNPYLFEKELPHLKDTGYLFYPDALHRYDLEQLIPFLRTADTDVVRYKNRILAFKPKNVNLGQDGLFIKSGRYFDLNDQEGLITFRDLNIANTPMIFCYTHNRPLYFELTVNSLMFNLKNFPEIPVSLILNDPCPKTIEIAKSFAEKYEQVNVLVANENLRCFAINLAVQYHNDYHSFIMLEDDIILPMSLRENFPHWPYQITQRLSVCDYICAPTTLCNLPPHTMPDWWMPETYRFGWNYYKDGSQTHVMAQFCAFSREYYIELAHQNGVVTDSQLKGNARLIGVPGIPCYHLSWNSRMDDYYNHEEWLQCFSKEPKFCKVFDLKGHNEYYFNSSDI